MFFTGAAARFRRRPFKTALLALGVLVMALPAVALLLALTFGIPAGWSDHVPGFLTRPPRMPANHYVVFANPYDCQIFRRNPDVERADPDALTWVVPPNVQRIGASGPVIYGIRSDPATKRQVGFILDTSIADGLHEIALGELDSTLHERYGIDDPATVPSRFYAYNRDGGPVGTD